MPNSYPPLLTGWKERTAKLPHLKRQAPQVYASCERFWSRATLGGICIRYFADTLKMPWSLSLKAAFERLVQKALGD